PVAGSPSVASEAARPTAGSTGARAVASGRKSHAVSSPSAYCRAQRLRLVAACGRNDFERGHAMLRVFLVDDHEVVRRGVAELLASQPDMELVGEAATYREALGRVAATLPDVAVLDVQLPDGNGAELCREIRQRHPRVRCLMFTAFDDDDAVFASILADASGYLLKSAHGVDLVHANQRIAAGHRLINPVAAQRAAQQMRAMAADDPRFGSLGLRERQILALIADGLTNRLIAD